MGADPLLGAGAEALSQYLEHGKIEDWGRVGAVTGAARRVGSFHMVACDGRRVALAPSKPGHSSGVMGRKLVSWLGERKSIGRRFLRNHPATVAELPDESVVLTSLFDVKAGDEF